MLRPLGPPPAAAGLSPSTSSPRQRQGGPSGPWPVNVNPNTRPRPWPLGALATTGRGFVVLSCCGRRPRAHSQRTSPAPAPRSWRPRAWPCCPGRACAPDHRAKHGRPIPLPCPPAAARERRLRRAGARGAARPNAAAAAAAAAPSRSGRGTQGLRAQVARGQTQQMPGCFNGGGRTQDQGPS